MQTPYKQYIKSFLITFLPLLCLVLFFTVGIDPFESFHQLEITHLNSVKTNVHENMRLYKANRILTEKPTGIILGSSRVMAGIDPEDLKAITGDQGYNCGLAAANIEEVYKYFLHALYAQPNLKTVILGLDFFCFNAYEETKEDLPRFLHGESPLILERLPAMFSYSALKAGVQTFYNNFRLTPLDIFYPNGMFNPEIAASNEANPIMSKEHEYIKAIHKSGMYREFEINEESIKKFESLVAICKERNIILKVFINPVQAVYWEAMFQHGYWEKMEALKRRLANIHPLWDFGGFNAITSQVRKSPDNLLYYECSHFRPLLGKVILDILFDRNFSPIQFGYFLEPEMIEENLFAMRQERESWALAHTHIIAELKSEIHQDETHLVTK